MSTETSQATRVGPAAAPSEAEDLDRPIFEEAMEAILKNTEIKGMVGAETHRTEELREHLWDSRDAIAQDVVAERTRWVAAADRAADPRQAIEAEEKDEKTWVYRFVQTPAALLGLFALCSVVVYLLFFQYHTKAWWWPGMLISLAVFGGGFVIAMVFGTLNVSWVAKREAGPYNDAANMARSEYADVIRKSMLGLVRAWINAKSSEHIDPSRLAVKTAPGLAAIYNREYMVSSEASDQLTDLFGQLSVGGTIGLAGPRGAGKTSLIRKYSPEETNFDPATAFISLLVSAPVEYQPIDFVLHLLYLLSGAYLDLYGVLEDSGSHAPMPRISLGLRSSRSRKRQPAAGEQPDNGKHDQLIGAARRYRQQIQAQLSYTTTVGAALSTPAAIATASGQLAATTTALPWSYPELVSKFCAFLRDIARELYELGLAKNAVDADSVGEARGIRGCVLIGIDEIDKINDGQQAQRFVNELKVVLGVPYCYYLIAVSDDALAAYEMRGMQVRDAFDSAFDEIIHVRYFRLGDSRKLLSRRVIGFPGPFVCLCHCLSGGLPRDLIRVARHAVIIAHRKHKFQSDHRETEFHSDHLETVCQQLILEDLRYKLDVGVGNWAGHQVGQAESQLLHSVRSIVTFHPDNEDRHEGCDLCIGSRLRAKLEQIVAGLAPVGPPQADQKEVAVSGIAVYLYYLLTLLDVFTAQLSATGKIVDANGNTASKAAFDQLCGVRQTLGAEPYWTWLTITAFRERWGLGSTMPLPNR